MNQAWFPLILMSVTSIHALAQSNTRIPTKQLLFKNIVLKRKERFITFPQSATIGAAISLSKALLDAQPRGLYNVIELEHYINLPGALDDWIPKLLKKKPNPKQTTTTKVAIDNLTKENVPSLPDEDFHNDDYEYFKPEEYNYNNNNNDFYYNSNDFQNILRNRRGYRERRDVFNMMENFGEIFNIDIKSCIQRAMCEARFHLRPYGESLTEDLFRILLTLPEDPNNINNFGATSDVDDCNERYALSCPFEVMQLLTHQLRKS